MKLIDIYIADDHKMFTDGVELILASEPEINVLGVARNGKQLLGLLHSQPANVVLLDITMPEMDGMATAEEIMKLYPAVKVMMLTMHNTIDHVVPMVKMGVHGYLLKNTGKTELVNAIKQLHENGQYYSGEVATKLAAGIREHEEKTIKLTAREKEILQLVFDGLSTLEISEKLFLSHRTVETHRSNLLSKTETKNTAQLINFGLKNGYINHKAE
ncbi:MAG: response regulator transcription factor [Bacteroidetes bacterium]|nr:MAG: response regulator transcription factor [Bacteroidota bacterium]